jgi:8-oxo-dGTP pyrophosphatase MutT (NUDIX family)
MTLLATLHDTDIGHPAVILAAPEQRTTARAVLLDDEGRAAIMYVGSKNYHKLPGGGLEGEETVEQGLARELHEETGCTAHILRPLGLVEEYRGRGNFLQTSHGFLAKVAGEKGIPPFDEGERANGFVLKWLPLTEALALLTSETNHPDYEARFINRRETAFLQAATKALSL